MSTTPVTTLTITPVSGTKGATLVGEVAVGEAVLVTLAGLGLQVASGLVLAITGCGGTALAKAEEWVAVGADAGGTLWLNWTALDTAMAGVGRNGKQFTLSVWNLLAQGLIVSTTIRVLPNPYAAFTTDGESVAPWGTDLTTEHADIDALEADMLAHAHGGGDDGAQVDHADLANIGANSHATIDAALAAALATEAALADRASALEGRATAVETRTGALEGRATLAEGRLTVLEAALASLLAIEARVAALEAAAAPVNLGWTIGAGTTLRSVVGDNPTIGDLCKAVRTLAADLRAQGKI
ncbi:MAG: hypothetical protein PHR35_22875 [Kiritimatiellae bacterium]|nr:hypothetical protein [Kiritimatiellia bacterium]